MDKIKTKSYPYTLALPGLILFAIFFLVPSFFGFLLSFTHTIGYDISHPTFAGLSNYLEIFNEPQLQVATYNTFIFAAITTFGKVVLGIILAVILNQELKSRNILRSIFFLPATINTIAVGLIFTSVMHPDTGLINKTLRLFGLGMFAQNWLADIHLAIFSVSSIEIWKWTGFTMVIILAGLQAIPKELYESGSIDGVTTFEKFRYITFPMALPSINNAFIINIIGGLKVFDLIQGTTQGGPGFATQVFGTQLFQAFGQGRFGEGCAENIMLALVVALVAIPVYKSIRSREVEV